MSRHRCVGVIAVFVFVAAIAAPVFAGGSDVPGITPGAKIGTQVGTFHVDGGNDAPAIPPTGHKPGQTASSRVWNTARLGWFTEILSVVWGGGSPKPRH